MLLLFSSRINLQEEFQDAEKELGVTSPPENLIGERSIILRDGVVDRELPGKEIAEAIISSHEEPSNTE
jgi:hypothetical protein